MAHSRPSQKMTEAQASLLVLLALGVMVFMAPRAEATSKVHQWNLQPSNAGLLEVATHRRSHNRLDPLVDTTTKEGQVQAKATNPTADANSIQFESTAPEAVKQKTVTEAELEKRKALGLCVNDCNGNGYCFNSSCLCMDGWAGDVCDTKVCPNDCSSHGSCQNGECQCAPGYYGPACAVRGCLNNCNGNGYCHDQVCVCFGGFMGLYCEDELGCPGHCNAPNGVCVDNKCYCKDGFTGDGCKALMCPGNCNGQGTCDTLSGRCTCKPGFFGEDCTKRFCPNNCSGLGTCDHSSGQCLCRPGYYGEDCAPTNCYFNCSGNGTCKFNNATNMAYCECERGRGGVGCESELCPQMCNEATSKGQCTPNGCKCSALWGGAACDTRRCPFDCTNAKQGLCDVKNGYTCNCLDGFTGLSCNELTCPYDCNYRGVCNNGTCACRDWWEGNYCELPTCKNDCSKNGKCIKPKVEPLNPKTELKRAVSGSAAGNELKDALSGVPMASVEKARCECNFGWGGADCSYKLCPNDCSSNGVCTAGVCFCDTGFYGDDCSMVESIALGPAKNTTAAIDARVQCESRCVHGKCIGAVVSHSNVNGVVNGTTVQNAAANITMEYTCFCEEDWAGFNCDKPLGGCLPQCRNEAGICQPDCNGSETCPRVNGKLCNGHGKCDLQSGKCQCDTNWRGDACSTSPCPNDCSNHGFCNSDKAECICLAGFGGSDCSASLSS